LRRYEQMLTIRLRRGGAKHKPYYRLVVSDSRRRPTSSYLDEVGSYNPHADPPEIKIDLDKVAEWEGKGAGTSESVRALIRKARA
jgi:small subunit ribosomal protein S16